MLATSFFCRQDGCNLDNREFSGGPSYTMSERSNIRGFSEDLAKTPGPARYGSTENNIYLKKNPQELAQILTRGSS